MVKNLTEQYLINFTNQQIKNILISDDDVSPYVNEALDKLEVCFKPNNNKYYQNKESFSVFHSGQYSIFLYYLSNIIFKRSGNTEFASKIYYLNKILHAVDWFYAIDLPSFWGVEHPVGSVLGRAKYQDGLFIYQGCTVGGNKKKYPILGRNVIMYSNSSILGDSKIGDNVMIAAGTIIKDQDVPNNSIVFGQSPNLIIKEKSETYILELIDEIWTRNRSEN